MAGDPLAENTIKLVVDAEKEIGAMLEAERHSSAEWLEKARQEIQQSLELELENLARLEEAARNQARKEAEREGELLVRKAREQAENYAAIGDEVLDRLVRRHLEALIPEMGDDRPDEQN